MSRPVNSRKDETLRSLKVQHLRVTGNFTGPENPNAPAPGDNSFVTIADERMDYPNSRRLLGTAGRVTVTNNGGPGTLVVDVDPALTVPGSVLTFDDEANFPEGRQLLGTANQIVLTENAGPGTVVASFPLAAPPQTAFAPTVGSHLVNKDYCDTNSVFDPSTEIPGSVLTFDDEANFPEGRQLLGTANQIVLTENAGPGTVVASFPLAAPPQTAFAPTVGNHLANKTYVDAQLGNFVNNFSTYHSLDDFVVTADEAFTPVNTTIHWNTPAVESNNTNIPGLVLDPLDPARGDGQSFDQFPSGSVWLISFAFFLYVSYENAPAKLSTATDWITVKFAGFSTPVLPENSRIFTYQVPGFMLVDTYGDTEVEPNFNRSGYTGVTGSFVLRVPVSGYQLQASMEVATSQASNTIQVNLEDSRLGFTGVDIPQNYVSFVRLS